MSSFPDLIEETLRTVLDDAYDQGVKAGLNLAFLIIEACDTHNYPLSTALSSLTSLKDRPPARST
jgi:hypothetical protein